MMFIHPEFTYDPDWYKSDSSIKETSEEKNDGGLIATIERKSDSESDEPTPQFSKPRQSSISLQILDVVGIVQTSLPSMIRSPHGMI
jgi:hypothetical protein